MANYIIIDKEAKKGLSESAKNVVSAKMNFSILRYTENTLNFLKNGFETIYSTAIKRKLKRLSPNYVVSGDIQRSKKLVFATTSAGGNLEFGGTGINARTGEMDRFFKFNLRLPEHAGNRGRMFQYGYALGDENSRLTADLDVLTQWVWDKRESGKFMLNGKPIETMKQALSVAYLINRKNYNEKIRHSAPNWYTIGDELTVSNMMKRLSNLSVFIKAFNSK